MKRRLVEMTAGPIEYLVVGFAGDTPNDDIAPALADLVDKEAIRILDLVFLQKDAVGHVSFLEFDELDQLSGFANIDAEIGGLISPEDIDFVGEELDESSSAAVLLLEDLWAAPLAEAVDRSGGLLLGGARIPKDLADEATARLSTAR